MVGTNEGIAHGCGEMVGVTIFVGGTAVGGTSVGGTSVGGTAVGLGVPDTLGVGVVTMIWLPSSCTWQPDATTATAAAHESLRYIMESCFPNYYFAKP